MSWYAEACEGDHSAEQLIKPKNGYTDQTNLLLHELLHIIQTARTNQRAGRKQVLATVVDLDGSSYRKPGVRMLIDEAGNTTGAVSGGCVEKEVVRRAQIVFETGQARVMTYDGRYRLGCEGVLYILLEPLQLTDELEAAVQELTQQRKPFRLCAYYCPEDDASGLPGTKLVLPQGDSIAFGTNLPPKKETDWLCFEQVLAPRFRLLLIGGEHDSVKLCQMAALLGWEVEVITSWREPRQLSDFPGAERVEALHPDHFDTTKIDEQTAVVLMSHNFSLDLKYLLRLRDSQPTYLGIIGSAARRDRLQDELLNLAPDSSLEFVENIHSPAGLDIGAITPEEIGLSVLAEIMSVIRERTPGSLKDRSIAMGKQL